MQISEAQTKLYRTAVLLVGAALVVIQCATIVVETHQFIQPAIDLRTSVLPGDKMPVSGICFPEPGMSNYPNLYCEQMQDSTEVYYTFDENEGAVVVATYMILGRFNAGQLIQAWGTPTGFNRDGVAVTIYWPEGRYAYFADAEITPFSPVGFVSFSKRHLDYKPWRGFNNNQESSPNE